MFDVLVKFKGQAAQVFGIPNVEHVKALASMDNVEWVLGPINETGCIVTTDKHISYPGHSYPEAVVSPTYPTPSIPHTCPPVLYGGNFSPVKMAEFIRAIQDEKKIVAIKTWREMSGMGLKESKDIVDRVYPMLAPPF